MSGGVRSIPRLIRFTPETGSHAYSLGALLVHKSVPLFGAVAVFRACVAERKAFFSIRLIGLLTREDADVEFICFESVVVILRHLSLCGHSDTSVLNCLSRYTRL